jgi:hypothetical protein
MLTIWINTREGSVRDSEAISLNSMERQYCPVGMGARSMGGRISIDFLHEPEEALRMNSGATQTKSACAG